MKEDRDTIAAIATAQGQAAIGIIRISGDGAFETVDAVYRNARGERALLNLTPGMLRYGFAVDLSEQVLDEIMAVRFKAPHSYTGEDMVELQCHGGVFVLRCVLEAVLDAGARLAEPGEFSRRAFLNGRMDLSQAEAVMDVIAADNERALSNAQKQLSGRLADTIRGLRERLLTEAAFIEAALDDPDSYAGELAGYPDRLAACTARVQEVIGELLAHADEGILLRQGVPTAIIGRPNAGKSSTFNLLAGQERAIVTAIPGTTRDTLEEQVRIGDVTLRLIDTAGIETEVYSEPGLHMEEPDGSTEESGSETAPGASPEKGYPAGEPGRFMDESVSEAAPGASPEKGYPAGEPGGFKDESGSEAAPGASPEKAIPLRDPDEVERIGMERAGRALREAQLILFVMDAAAPAGEETRALFALTEGKKRILLANKIDLIEAPEKRTEILKRLEKTFPGTAILPFSAKCGEGLDALRDAVSKLILCDGDLSGQDYVITSLRHRRLLEEAQTSLSALEETIRSGLSEDFYTVDLMNAYRTLGEIIGAEVGEDLIEEIFSKFCMGK